ncbi:unnamed protein product, partial [Mesorhabditis spiculigera]
MLLTLVFLLFLACFDTYSALSFRAPPAPLRLRDARLRRQTLCVWDGYSDCWGVCIKPGVVCPAFPFR